MKLASKLIGKHATEMLEQTLGNSTAVAQGGKFAVSNSSALLSTVNTGTKALSLGYGIALTGASGIDAFTARNAYSRCLFGIGCICGAIGTCSSAVTALNVSAVLAPISLVSSASGTAFYWLGRKATALGRVTDLPVPGV